MTVAPGGKSLSILYSLLRRNLLGERGQLTTENSPTSVAPTYLFPELSNVLLQVVKHLALVAVVDLVQQVHGAIVPHNSWSMG